MKVALFGGTGFVGSYLIDELISNNHLLQVLVRPGSEHKLRSTDKSTLFSGDIRQPQTIQAVLETADAVIYNIGILREFPNKGITYNALHFSSAKNCIDIAQELGVQRFILMSANGVKAVGVGYQTTKYLAEQYLKNSSLDWTIFQPSLIFGDPRGNSRSEFCSQLKKDMLSLPLPAPLFFDGLLPFHAGEFAMSPIHVRDVAQFFIKALDKKDTYGKSYQLGGPTAYTWKEIIDIIAAGYGKGKWKIPAPVLPVKILAALLGRYSWFPITKDQLTMLMAGNTCDSTQAYEQFGIKATEFNSETVSYLSGN